MATGSRNALSAMRGYRSFRRLARLRASPSRRFQNLPLRKDIQHPPRVATRQQRPDLRGRLKFACNSQPRKYSLCISKRVSLLKSKL